ncbi:MAG TPA: glucose 1-dehydrogenase [Terriglobales bacterium]|nr:glucose 1-dehydrogenase [Terriglobales bacterium]
MTEGRDPYMQAITIIPRTPHSSQLRDVPQPTLESVPNGRGVLVKIIRVGVDGTDHELQEGLYGAPPSGFDYLVEGHESFGQVQKVGPNIHELEPGDYVVATVRRPGSSVYDRIGEYDFTTDDTYYERGINLLHGFLTEYYVDQPEYIVRIPPGLKDVAVLLEPTSIIEKGIAQAFEIQRRLKVWQPRRALVMGAGSIGLLATFALVMRGIDVTVLGKDHKPYLNSDLIGQIGAFYESTDKLSIADAARQRGPFDIILECTGYSPIAFECMQVLAKNGVLVLASVTGGNRTITVPSDQINLGFVLGNKVMVGTVNANRTFFEMGVEDMALAAVEFPGWLSRLITTRVHGLANYKDLFAEMSAPGQIKVVCEIAA